MTLTDPVPDLTYIHWDTIEVTPGVRATVGPVVSVKETNADNGSLDLQFLSRQQVVPIYSTDDKM